MTTADSGSDFQSLLDSEESAPRLERGHLITGKVLALDSQGMIVDLGQKRDGVVPRAEIDKLTQQGKTFEVGQEVAVVVTNPEDKEGNLVVSISQGRHQQDWVQAEKLLQSGEVWEGAVSGYNKGGLIVPFGEIQAFVPNSQVIDLPRELPENERPARLQSLVGRRMGFKVIELDRQRRRLVLSQRKAQREYRDKQKAQLFDDLTEGQVRKGVVTALRDFGAFVDLGGADGLVHISEIAWHRVKHANEVLRVGQEVEVEVLKVDRESKRIGLSLKRRLADPWSKVGERFDAGQELEGVVTRVAPFGAFVDLGEGIEGLLHSSQWGNQEPPAEGEAVRVKVLRVEPERQRIGLSLLGRTAPPAQEQEADEMPDDEDETTPDEYGENSAEE